MSDDLERRVRYLEKGFAATARDFDEADRKGRWLRDRIVIFGGGGNTTFPPGEEPDPPESYCLFVFVNCMGFPREGATVTITSPPGGATVATGVTGLGGFFGWCSPTPIEVGVYIGDPSGYSYETTVLLDTQLGKTIRVEICDVSTIPVLCCGGDVPRTVTATLGSGSYDFPVDAYCGAIGSIFGSHANNAYSLTYDASVDYWRTELGPNGVTVACYFGDELAGGVTRAVLSWRACPAGSSPPPFGYFFYEAYKGPTWRDLLYAISGRLSAGSPCVPVAAEFTYDGLNERLLDPIIATVTE